MIPHFCVLAAIILVSTIYYYYMIYLPYTKKAPELVSPESFLSFEEHYSNIVNNTIEPKYYSRFKTFNEYKL